MNNLIETVQTFIVAHSEKWTTDLLMTFMMTIGLWFAWKIIYRRLLQLTKKTQIFWDDVILLALKSPVSSLIWSWPILSAIDLILEIKFNKQATWIDTVEDILLIIIPVWIMMRLIRNIEKNVLKDPNKDRTTVHAVSKLARLIVILMGVLTTLQTLGLSLSGLLTFGGVGGLITGMAAKDLLANFFGGMMIYMDKPFKVGDWIRSPDRNIEGTVEKVGWRVTSIRTFDKRPIYVPNSVFANIVVENPSRMYNRRISEVIGLRYQDSHKIEAIMNDIRLMLQSHKDIAQHQTIIVNFHQFGPSSLDFMLYAFTQTIDWVRYQEVKQNVLLAVIGIIHQHDADIAFPTQQLHVSPSEHETLENQST